VVREAMSGVRDGSGAVAAAGSCQVCPACPRRGRN
jgi:hypothetical protein